MRAIEEVRPSFDDVVAEHQEDISRLVHRLLGWSGEAEDVVQDVFVRALRGWPRFQGRAEVRTWLSRIAVNACRSHRRRQWLLNRRQFTDPSSGVTACRSADGAAIDRETFERVRRAVRSLPAKYREVVVLRYLEQMDTKRIAEVLAISASTLNVRLHRARVQLVRELSDLREVLSP